MRRIVTLLFVAASLALAPAADANKPKLTPSKHRKIKKGVGNCVFAKQPLPFAKEKEWKEVTTTFTTGDTVHARCFYPKQLQAFAKKGKLMNELRDERTYRISLEVHERKKRRVRKNKMPPSVAALPVTIVRVKQDGEEEWDQREYELDPTSKRCLFKSHLGTNGCLDPERAAQELAMLAGKTGVFTAEMCLTTWVEYADKQKGQAGSGAVEAIRKRDELTKGCFEWATEVKPPPPDDAKPDEANKK